MRGRRVTDCEISTIRTVESNLITRPLKYVFNYKLSHLSYGKLESFPGS